MNTIEKALDSFDALLKQFSKEEHDHIVAEVDSLPTTGPNVSDYFNLFDSQFDGFQLENNAIGNLFPFGIDTAFKSENPIIFQEVVEVKQSRNVQFELRNFCCLEDMTNFFFGVAA